MTRLWRSAPNTWRVRFTTVGGLHVATVQLALFAGDRRQEVVGELWQTLELKFTDQRFAEVSAEGYRDAVRLSVTAAPRHIKAAVYDPGGDSLGSSLLTIE